MSRLGQGIKNAWNAFIRGDPSQQQVIRYGYSTSYRPDRNSLSSKNARSIVAPILNRIAIDVAAISMEHAQLDDDDRFVEAKDSEFNSCLNLEANIDQTGRAFRQDIFLHDSLPHPSTLL